MKKRVIMNDDGRLAIRSSEVIGYHLVDVQIDGEVKHAVSALLRSGNEVLVTTPDDKAQAEKDFEERVKTLK